VAIMNDLFKFRYRLKCIYKYIFAFVVLGLSVPAVADNITCSKGVIDGVIVVADRANAHDQSNKLFIILHDSVSAACETEAYDRYRRFIGYKNVKYGYIDSSSSAYKAVLSVVLSAYVKNLDVEVLVDERSDIDGFDQSLLVASDLELKAFEIKGIRID